MEPTETDIFDIFDFPIQHFPDRSVRWLLQDKENLRGLIEILAAQIAAHLDFTRLAQLNRSFVSDTLQEQESDLLFRVPFQGGVETNELIIYILIEHQSTVDVTMGFRVFSYMDQIWNVQRREWESAKVPRSEWRLRPILPIVFYTGTQPWNTPLSLTGIMDIPDALTRFVPSFDILFLSVKEAAASQLTRTGHPFGWLLTVLQKEHADKDMIRDTLQEAMSHLSALGTEHSEQLRRAVGYFLLLILHRRPTEEHAGLIRILDQHAHNMEVDTMAEALTGTLLEQGIEQGIEQGEIRGKRDAVLRALQIQFGSLPENITAQINAIQNLAQLDDLFEKIFEAETIDDIF